MSDPMTIEAQLADRAKRASTWTKALAGIDPEQATRVFTIARIDSGWLDRFTGNAPAPAVAPPPVPKKPVASEEKFLEMSPYALGVDVLARQFARFFAKMDGSDSGQKNPPTELVSFASSLMVNPEQATVPSPGPRAYPKATYKKALRLTQGLLAAAVEQFKVEVKRPDFAGQERVAGETLNTLELLKKRVSLDSPLIQGLAEEIAASDFDLIARDIEQRVKNELVRERLSLADTLDGLKMDDAACGKGLVAQGAQAVRRVFSPLRGSTPTPT